MSDDEEVFVSKIFDFEFEEQQYYIVGSHQLHPDFENCTTFINLSEGSIVFDFEKPWMQNYERDRDGAIRVFRFPIPEAGFPPNSAEFLDSVKFVGSQIIEKGANINISCDNGISNTGLFLTGIVHLLNQKSGLNAIEYVRSKYHDDAVDDITQLIYCKYALNIDIPQIDLPFVKIFEDSFKKTHGQSISSAMNQAGGFDQIGQAIYDAVENYESKIANYESKIVYQNSTAHTSTPYFQNNSSPNNSKLANLSFGNKQAIVEDESSELKIQPIKKPVSEEPVISTNVSEPSPTVINDGLPVIGKMKRNF